MIVRHPSNPERTGAARAALSAVASLAAAAALCLSCQGGGPFRPSVGVLERDLADPLCSGSRTSMLAAAAGRAQLTIDDSRGQAAVQQANFEALVAGRAKAVAISPVDEISARTIVIAAKDKSIPVVFFGSRPSDDSMRSWDKVFYVGAGDADAGAAQAEILAAGWKADPSADRNRDGKMQLALLTGESGRLQALHRAEHVVKKLEAAGVATDKLVEVSAGGKRESAKEKMAEAIAKFGGRIEAVACYDDTTALGAIDACEDAGLYKGKRKIPIVGVCDSGSLDAIGDALESGKLLGTAYLDAPAVGRATISLSIALATGRDPSKFGIAIQDAKFVRIPYRALTKESAAATAAAAVAR